MAPTASNSSNKDKKTINCAEGGIQETTLALSLVTAAAELGPTPYLRRAAGATLKMTNTVHSVGENKADLQQLVDDAAQFIAGIWKAYQEMPEGKKVDWPSQELRFVFREFALTLESISGFIEEVLGRNRFFRVFYSMADAGKIQKYRERLVAAMSEFGELDRMRSHLDINSGSSTNECHNPIENMTGVNINRIESTDLLKSVEFAKEQEEGECALEAERRHFAEEEEPHRLQLIENAGITEKRTRELQRLREVDEQATELQRLQDLEMARLAEEELKRPREDRQQSEQSCNAADQVVRVTEEKEREHKCMQKEEIGHIAAEEQESEPQHQEEKRARIEVQEQSKRQDEGRIRVTDQGKKPRRRRAKRVREQERDSLPTDKHRTAEAACTAEAEVKKQPGEPASEINKTPKMNARVEEEDDQQAVDVLESEEESEGGLDDETALEAARLAEARVNRKGKNKAKVNNGPTPPLGSAFADMNTRPTLTPHPISMPPMVHPPPFHSYQTYSPFRPPVMSMYAGHHEQPLYPSSFSPVTTINNVNSGNTSNFSASNINNDNSTKIEEKEKNHADEKQEGECRYRGEARKQPAEIDKTTSTSTPQPKPTDSQEKEKLNNEKAKNPPGEINKTKLSTAPRPKPTDSDSSKTSGKSKEEEKSANKAKNQPGENETKLMSTAQSNSTNSDSLKTSGKSKEVEKLAKETWRAPNKEMKVTKASTPPAQMASASTQRRFAKLNESPSPASTRPVLQPSIFHQVTRPDVETNSRRAWSRDRGDEPIDGTYLDLKPILIPASAHRRLAQPFDDDLGNRTGSAISYSNRNWDTGFPIESPIFTPKPQHPSMFLNAPTASTTAESSLNLSRVVSGTPQGYATPVYGAPQGYTTPVYGAPQGYTTPVYGAPQGYATPTPHGYAAPRGYATPVYGAPQDRHAKPLPMIDNHPRQPPPSDAFLGARSRPF